MQFGPEDLRFFRLRESAGEVFAKISDSRQPGKVRYPVPDCLQSTLGMMYFQEPSLLSFQRSMQERIGSNNLQTLFGVKSIPSDSQMRSVLDEVDPEGIRPVFTEYVRRLQRSKVLEDYRILEGLYLVALDASGYFGSEKVHCEGCLTKKRSDGSLHYSHQILQATLVKPGKAEVIPLAPEEIRNEDGTEKQDCEINAAKRRIRRLRQDHPQLPILLGGDGLYSKQPMIDAAKEARMHFLFVAKESDHAHLYEWIREQQHLGEVVQIERKDAKGRLHRYRFCRDVPIRAEARADLVNWIDYELKVGEKVTHRNSWVTDLVPTENNIEELVLAGRARWKIENETFNTLKNQGYHLEHNFGHGEKHLSFNFFSLNLLAFLLHQIQQLTEPLYQEARQKAGARTRLWETLRALTQLILFPNWDSLIHSMVHGLPTPRAP